MEMDFDLETQKVSKYFDSLRSDTGATFRLLFITMNDSVIRQSKPKGTFNKSVDDFISSFLTPAQVDDYGSIDECIKIIKKALPKIKKYPLFAKVARELDDQRLLEFLADHYKDSLNFNK